MIFYRVSVLLNLPGPVPVRYRASGHGDAVHGRGPRRDHDPERRHPRAVVPPIWRQSDMARICDTISASHAVAGCDSGCGPAAVPAAAAE